jgi:hypothetical protein
MRASLNQILVAKAEERSGGNRVGATEMKAFGKMLGATAATLTRLPEYRPRR